MPTHRELPTDWQAVHARRQAEVDTADRRARENRRRRAAGLPPLPPSAPPTTETSHRAPPPAQLPPAPKVASRQTRSRVLDISAGFLPRLAVLIIFVVISRDPCPPWLLRRAPHGDWCSLGRPRWRCGDGPLQQSELSPLTTDALAVADGCRVAPQAATDKSWPRAPGGVTSFGPVAARDRDPLLDKISSHRLCRRRLRPTTLASPKR
jgi:hypothetical protein